MAKNTEGAKGVVTKQSQQSPSFTLPNGSVSTTMLSTTVQQSLMPSGVVLPFAGSAAPTGYLLCDGSAVSRTTFSGLFAVVGTTYGIGDGSTTFNVPNTQGVFLRGAGSQTISGINYSSTQGSSQGDQMQGHRHSVSDPGHHHGMYPAGPGGGGSTDPATQNASGIIHNPPDMETTTDVTGLTVTAPSTDGTNGTPRTGTETRPANISVAYIIKT